MANLFAYTISDYSKSEAGAITGARGATTVDATASKAKITDSDLNGDVACFNFFDNNNASKLVFRQYTYSTDPQYLLANRIITPQGAWTSPVASQIWNAVANMHAVASYGNYLYATGYDLAQIAVVNMTSSYTQAATVTFPSALAETGHTYHGEGLAVLGDYLYVLFSDNIGTGYATYDNSYVVRYKITTSTGDLSYEGDYVRAGKNAFTLELHGSKMYICALGGMQNAGSANADTCISIVTVSRRNVMSVASAVLPTGVTGDFRDITITDDGNAYIFSGYYSSDYSSFIGHIYGTTITNLNAATPSAWTTLKTISDAGYFWYIYTEGTSNRFWFVKGNVIEVYPASSTLGTPQSFDSTALASNTNYTNINAACFIAADATATRGAAGVSHSAKSCVGQARLAREAHELAEKCKKAKK